MSFLKGKTLLLTGGGRSVLSDGSAGSIGYGIAVAYAQEGANIVITGRNLGKLNDAKEQLTNLYNQQEATKAELGKPFPQEAELAAKSQRLAELDAALNMEETTESRAERGSERPSVLADLKSKSEHIPPAHRHNDTREEVL